MSAVERVATQPGAARQSRTGSSTGSQGRFYVHGNGAKLHYLEFGVSGPDVLILPGITSPAITWSFVARRIAEFARVFVLDARGKGLSEQRADLTYALNDYAGDAAAFIEVLGIEPTVVLGHSVGARVGIRLAARFADRVSRLILVDPPVTGPGRRPYPIPLDYYLDNIAKASRGEPVRARDTWTPEQVALRNEWLPTCSIQAVVSTYRALHTEDIHADLSNVRCPTLLVQAENGGTITDDEARELITGLADGRKVKLAGVGHMVPWDDLEAFLDSIRGMVTGDGR